MFEPNGSALWANVRRTVEDFLFNEWQSPGTCSATSRRKAFFVQCDRTTMTQNDLDNGRLICLIGVAPLRPAEFVIFRIGQWTARPQGSMKETRMACSGTPVRRQFNFLVDLGDRTSEGPKAGFQEVSGLGMEITVAEYRAGNYEENSVR